MAFNTLISTSRHSRFYAAYLAPAIILSVVIVLLDFTDTDLIVTSWFYDKATSAFPWHANRFLEVVMHHWIKYFVALVALAAVAGFAASFQFERLKSMRSLLLFVALALIVAPATVTALKYFSPRHCPWDLALFGGYAPHIRLLDSYPAGIRYGHCFPAGHASTGFCLFAFHFAGRAISNRKLAYGGLALGLVAGLGLGFIRIMQGAHFVSHVLASAVVCWIVITLLYVSIFSSRE